MTPDTQRMTLMIAHARQSPWATRLAACLSPLPVDVQWSRSDHEAIDLVSGGQVHIGVVDYDLPRTSGLELVRRFRRLGWTVPCVLVCDGASQRLLSDALELDVFSVVQASDERELVAPHVMKLAHQKYRVTWTLPPGGN